MRLVWKLYLGYLALVLVTGLAVGGLADRWLEADALGQLERDLRGEAALVEELAPPALDGRVAPRLQRRLAAFGRRHPTRITVIGAGGRVLADSDEDPDRLGDHANRPEVLEAARSGAPAAVARYSHSANERLLYVAVPVAGEGGRPAGYVRAAAPLHEVAARLGRLRAYAVAGTALAAVAALVPAFLLARRVVEPLGAMTAAARAFARGDYEARPPAGHGRDEVATLARAFAAMAERLRDHVHGIDTDRAKLRAILSSMVEGVVAVDRDERIVHLNEIAAEILGIDPVAGLGHRIWEATRVPEVSDTLSVALHRSMATRLEVHLTASPRDRVLELHASPLRDADGVTSGAVVVLHDVTALRRLETLRREFVANVSHELKTPLTAMGGMVETLLDDDSMDAATQRRFLSKIRDQTARLSALVHDLLTLSRVESEEEFLQREPLDLREPVEESSRTLRPARTEKELTLEREIGDEPLMIQGDREALRQVVDNLLDNAVKYTPPQGRIWLRARREGREAVVEVEDTGIGLEAADQDRIFERFYRVDKARSRALGGTGLGLSIVKHIALAHRGRVSVDSIPGKGSAFAVRFPLAPEA